VSKNGKKSAKELESVINNSLPEDISSGQIETERRKSASEAWNKSTNPPSNSGIDKILEVPPLEDTAGWLQRGNFKNDEQRIATVLLTYFDRKFKDNDHLAMARDYVCSGMSMGGFGKILQAFIGTNLLAPDMLRASLGMPKSKNPEEVHRSSDFKNDGQQREVNDRGTQ
jgi:hypothetical protein